MLEKAVRRAPRHPGTTRRNERQPRDRWARAHPEALDAPTELRAFLVRQPADYIPSPRELMLLEEPLPPAGLEPFAIVPR